MDGCACWPETEVSRFEEARKKEQTDGKLGCIGSDGTWSPAGEEKIRCGGASGGCQPSCGEMREARQQIVRNKL